MAAILNTNWYINAGNTTSTGYYAITKWATATSYTVGQIVRPLTSPSAANERAYICIIAGVSATEPTWTFTKGAVNAGSLETFQECTGQAALNGDATTSPIWVASSTYSLGMIVMNTGRTGYFIASAVAGTGTSAGSQPAGLTTPVLGATTVDNSGANQVTWTCIKATGAAFTTWGAPFSYTTNALVATWGAAGNDFYIGSASAETTAAAVTLTFPGTAAAPNRMFSVTTAGSVPPVAADLTSNASVTTTGINNLTVNGSLYAYGTTFTTGNSLLVCQTQGEQFYDACVANFAVSLNAVNLSVGASQSPPKVTWQGGSINVTNTAAFNVTISQGYFIWRNSSFTLGSGTINNNGLFTFATSRTGIVIVDGVDLSAIPTLKAIAIAPPAGTVFLAKNCKITSGTVLTTAVPTVPGVSIDAVWIDSAATDYIQSRRQYQGSLDVDTTKYNNATDGTTPISWKIVTSANSKRQSPFETFEIVQWVATGTYTATTVQCTSATGSLLNSDIWLEAEYMGSSATPVSSLATSGPATQLTTGSSLAAGSWATGGAGNNYSLALPSFTVNIAGYVRFTVKVAKASLTIYVDPAVTVA